MPIPVRAAPGDFHFHTYDYGTPAAPPAPWTLSPPVGAAGNMQFYSLLEDLLELAQEGAGVPNIALGTLGGLTAGNKAVRMLSFGNAANNPAAPAVVITGGIHAREWMAAEFVYLLAEYLIMHYTAHPGNRFERTIRDLVDSRRIFIIPMLNPDGNDYTVFGGQRLWRKNRRALETTSVGWIAAVSHPPFANAALGVGGNVSYDVPKYPLNGVLPAPVVLPLPGPDVADTILYTHMRGVDLNRNMPTDGWGWSSRHTLADGTFTWTDGAADSDTYFGANPGGEAETQNLAALLAATAGISAAIDYHAYGKVILFPSEAFNTGLITPDYRALGKALKQVVHAPFVRDYRLGSARQILGYDATGSVIDHLAQQHHARAFTIEVDPRYDPNDTPAQEAQKFQLPENEISYVFEKNIRGALALLAAPPQSANPAQALAHKNQIGNTALQFLTWNVYGRGNQLPNLPL